MRSYSIIITIILITGFTLPTNVNSKNMNEIDKNNFLLELIFPSIISSVFDEYGESVTGGYRNCRLIHFEKQSAATYLLEVEIDVVDHHGSVISHDHLTYKLLSIKISPYKNKEMNKVVEREFKGDKIELIKYQKRPKAS
ncbi:hypothetical protein DS745_22980 [Anaerobacillus alkaliphilus]|uniref:DUF3888 domain-containing protein n=1 Tax=Anaerobacillus alkaliphilus TaxID=1548597 RepID=A0A4Q0VMJ9_9BACI|nr:hypothetical protein [Anaerobacillus alkaliphilus]RXI96571.1 hypothetical protein DS745_22980 [Anaerobacillus alkaliphilus]